MANKMNLTLLADFYELTMANGYWEHGIAEQTAYYDLFFRKVPDQGGFAIMAGLEQAIDYMKNLKFTDETLHSCVARTVLLKRFWNICVILSSFVMCGRCRKGLQFSRMNRF